MVGALGSAAKISKSARPRRRLPDADISSPPVLPYLQLSILYKLTHTNSHSPPLPAVHFYSRGL